MGVAGYFGGEIKKSGILEFVIIDNEYNAYRFQQYE